MSTPQDEERLLSDSSATDGMGNQLNVMDKQLVIENTFAEEQEEDQKGDSIGLDVSQEKTEVDPAPVREANRDEEGIDDLGKIEKTATSQVKVCAHSGMTQPGGSALAQVHPPMKKAEEGTTQIEEARSVIECVDPLKQKLLKEEEEEARITEPKTLPEAVQTAVEKYGGNEFHLFFHLIEKDAKLPEGDFFCSGSCDCGKYCGGSRGKCVIGYQFNRIKVASVKEGPTTAAIQWNDRKHPNVTLLFKTVKMLINIFLLIFSLCNFSSKLYQSAQKGQILFDALSSLVSFVGSVVSTISLFVFLVRRHVDVIKTWGRLFSCVHAMSTVDGIRLTCCGKTCMCCCKCCYKRTNYIVTKRAVPLKDRMKGSRCCGCWITQLQRLNRLKTTRGKWTTIFGNFSEIVLTVLEEYISTVNIVLSLYTFIGKRQYRVFYIVTELSELTTIAMIILSFLLFLISHIDRIRHIAMNIYNFDQDIAKISELKRNWCQRLFGFQGLLVLHAFFLSLLQVYCMLALAWKIIRDHCISEEEARATTETTNTNGRVVTSTLLTEFGPLRGCSVPSFQPLTVNGYTIYNIFYVSVLLPYMSYVLFFVSNVPFFVEYCQLLHASGMYKFERAVEESEKEEVEKGVTPYSFLEILAVFVDVLNPNCKFSEEDLKRKKDEIREKRDKVQKDIIKGVYNNMGKKIIAVLTFFPIVIFGFIHSLLFFSHIAFLTCRYSPQFGIACFSAFDNFSVFTHSLTIDRIVVIVPLVLLFCLSGFPGSLVTIMWMVTIYTAIMMVVPLILVLCAVLCICGSDLFPNTNPRPASQPL